MLDSKRIAVVVPAYNEGTQISKVINTMPEIVDKIIVVNDESKDNTRDIVETKHLLDSRVHLINHEKNLGVGGAIATGYKYARENNFDVTVVMAGDAQMDPKDLPAIVEPVAKGEVDYSKGNRLFSGEAYQKIPKVRYFGNSILSLFTKIASGYWHVADSQTGYTGISLKALKTINWDKMYKRYGQPNDLLVRLNVYNFRVRDIPIAAVYNVGEKSGIKLRKVIFTIPWILLKMFLWRMKEKYIIRDFHPLVFFYFLGALFGTATIMLFTRLLFMWVTTGVIPPINALAAMFSFMSSSLFTMFAMWFDMEVNKGLK